MQSYEQIKKSLIQRRQELETRLGKIKQDISQPLDHDFAEQAVELENGEVMEALGSEAEIEIAKINSALIRIDDGVYGDCVDCGTHIPEARLQVRPYSSRCVGCAEKLESAQ